MKTYLLSLLIATQALAVAAQDNHAPYQTKSLANDAIKEVYVQTSGGSINVSGAGGESPRVEVYIRGNSESELSREEISKRLAEDYDLEVSVGNHELHALAKRKHGGMNWNWKKQLSISFKIFVPKNTDSKLETSGGSIHLDNLNGDERFSTSGGSLHVEALRGKIKGETSGGSIEVLHCSDDINLETSGGSIRAVACEGKIKLETSGGSLHLEDLRGTIDANTSGGSIQATKIEGEFKTGTSGGSVNLSQLACSLDASTSGGDMNVAMNRVGKYVKLDVSGGHVALQLSASQGMNLDLNAEKINNPIRITNFTGKWEKDHVKGEVAGGGIPVKVDASGHLDISFN